MMTPGLQRMLPCVFLIGWREQHLSAAQATVSASFTLWPVKPGQKQPWVDCKQPQQCTQNTAVRHRGSWQLLNADTSTQGVTDDRLRRHAAGTHTQMLKVCLKKTKTRVHSLKHCFCKICSTQKRESFIAPNTQNHQKRHL